jgi:hypothetical protein
MAFVGSLNTLLAVWGNLNGSIYLYVHPFAIKRLTNKSHMKKQNESKQ